MYYDLIGKHTTYVEIPSIKMKFTSKDVFDIIIKKIPEHIGYNENNCEFVSDRLVTVILRSKFKKNRMTFKRFVHVIDPPRSVKTINKIQDIGIDYICIVENSIFHNSSSAGIMDFEGKNNLVANALKIHLKKNSRIYYFNSKPKHCRKLCRDPVAVSWDTWG